MPRKQEKKTVAERFEIIRYKAANLLRPPKQKSPVKVDYLQISEADAVYLKRVYSKIVFNKIHKINRLHFISSVEKSFFLIYRI